MKCKWILVITLFVLQLCGAFTKVYFLDRDGAQFDLLASKNDLHRSKRSLTTICVEIKPNTPMDEPYFMCKGADLPILHKSSNVAIYGSQTPSHDSSHVDKKNKPFRSSTYENTFQTPTQNYEEKTQKDYRQQIPTASKYDANPMYAHGTPKNEPLQFFQDSNAKHFQSTSTFPESSDSFESPISLYGQTSNSQHQNSHSSHESTYEPVSKSASQSNGRNSAYDTQSISFKKNHSFQTPITSGSADEYISSNTRPISNTFRVYQKPYTNPREGSEKNFGHNHHTIGVPTSKTENGFWPTELSYREFESSDEARGEQHSQPNYENLQTVAKTMATKPLPYANDQLVPAVAYTHSASPKTASTSRTYDTQKIQETQPGLSSVDLLNRKPQTFFNFHPMFRQISDDIQAADLDDDVLGVPNWGFNPEEFNMVSSPELRNPISTAESELQLQSERNIPVDHLNDPIMRTFYQSLADIRPLSTNRVPETEHFPMLAKQNNQMQNLYLPRSNSQGETCPTYASIDAAPNVGTAHGIYNPTPGYPQSIYHPVLITLPCCGQQQTYSGGGLYHNMGMANPFQAQDPLVGHGNPFAHLFGMNRSFGWSNLLSLLNPFNSLLGEPNPMMNAANNMVGTPNRLLGAANPPITTINPLLSIKNTGNTNSLYSTPSPFGMLTSDEMDNNSADTKHQFSTTTPTPSTDSNESEAQDIFDNINDNKYTLKFDKSMESQGINKSLELVSTENPKTTDENEQQLVEENESDEESSIKVATNTSTTPATDRRDSREEQQQRYYKFANRAKTLVIHSKNADRSERESPMAVPSAYSSDIRHNTKTFVLPQPANVKRKYVQLR